MYLVQAIKLFKINKTALERLTIDLYRLLGRPKPSEYIEKFKNASPASIFKVVR